MPTEEPAEDPGTPLADASTPDDPLRDATPTEPEPAPAADADARAESEVPAPAEPEPAQPTSSDPGTTVADSPKAPAAAKEATAAADAVPTEEPAEDPGTPLAAASEGKERATTSARGLRSPDEKVIHPSESLPRKAPSEGSEASAGAPAAPTRSPDRTTPAPAEETITIRELLRGTVEIGEHDVFYVHSVTEDDGQGLWGIIQKGVTENFARGVSIRSKGGTDTYRVAVPKHADEVLDDRSSSPFGLMIYRKLTETIVYNRKRGRLTQDPDVTIFPGNELVIVGFKPEELIGLYHHFAGTDGR